MFPVVKLSESASYRHGNKISATKLKNSVKPWIIYEWMGNSTRQRFEIRLWKILIG